jgi:hypothetical protein
MSARHVQAGSRGLARLIVCYVWFNPLVQIAAARVFG